MLSSSHLLGHPLQHRERGVALTGRLDIPARVRVRDAAAHPRAFPVHSMDCFASAETALFACRTDAPGSFRLPMSQLLIVEDFLLPGIRCLSRQQDVSIYELCSPTNQELS